MKKLRVLLATAAMTSAFMVVGAPPAAAKCVGEPNLCVLICSLEDNKWVDALLPCEVI